jgi:multisubunit Na+/H+ antiporter MnhB subunit
MWMTQAISVLLLLGALAFGVSSLVFGISTYRVAKDCDREAARIGITLTGICILVGVGLVFLLILINGR